MWRWRADRLVGFGPAIALAAAGMLLVLIGQLPTGPVPESVVAPGRAPSGSERMQDLRAESPAQPPASATRGVAAPEEGTSLRQEGANSVSSAVPAPSDRASIPEFGWHEAELAVPPVPHAGTDLAPLLRAGLGEGI
ncbi:hypothetical protein GCM10012275_58230 [Longimycelium tulufanense]|uniref:Uncharacterized protein n=1 Tax=Longimycelium tulufanense TaxID=907463 RepID=A0A8J3CK37_9PSEU|nr:hypothetical protein [Longimycelium tulufanense]GGM79990.1 hypothetical protein GCM10012275_58230 [Longimycelium tulufanense]